MSKPLQLTNREILKTHEGLKALDGVPGPDGRIERFDLDDNNSWNCSKNRSIIEHAVDAYNKERRKQASALGVVDGMKITDGNAQSVATFLDKCESILDKTNDLNGLLRFKKADLLKAGVGKVPSILSNLMALLEP